jgi:hypothetical protein
MKLRITDDKKTYVDTKIIYLLVFVNFEFCFFRQINKKKYKKKRNQKAIFFNYFRFKNNKIEVF